MAPVLSGLPKWHSGKEPTCQCRRRRFNPYVEDPLGNRMAAPCSILALKFPQTEEAGSCSPWGCKELYVTEQEHE